MRFLLALTLLLPVPADPSDENLRLACVADTVLSSSGGEVLLNGGGRSNLRLKCVEDFPILDFDLAPLKGKVVEEARLFLCPTGPHKLRAIGLSTIGTPWKEEIGRASCRERV